MALKSFIISKLDHQMSKSWKGIAAHAFETTKKFDKLKNWVPEDCSGQDFDKKILDSKHVLKLYFKSSRKNPDFLFLPLPSELVWLKIHHLMKESILI
jgi:hypothetical protein